MASPLPQTIVDELEAIASPVEENMSHFLDEANPVVVQLLDAAERLAKADAFQASQWKGRIYALTGNRERVDYWFKNARALGRDWTQEYNHSSTLINMGYFSDAARLTGQYLDISTNKLTENVALAIGLFDLAGAMTAYEVLDRAQLHSEPILRSFAECAWSVLQTMNVRQEDVQGVLDIAGELLRENNLWWQGQAPRLFAFSSEEDSGILYELRIATSPQFAAELTEAFVERAIARDAYQPGFSFGFIGVGESSFVAGRQAAPVAAASPGLRRIR